MTALEKLEMEVKKMAEGEKRRRKVALEYVGALQDILLQVAEDAWGGDGGAVWLSRRNPKVPGEIGYADFYFRYRALKGDVDFEPVGFYYSPYGYPEWGTPVGELKGKKFWYFIQVVLEWVEILTEKLQHINEGRDKLARFIPAEGVEEND